MVGSIKPQKLNARAAKDPEQLHQFYQAELKKWQNSLEKAKKLGDEPAIARCQKMVENLTRGKGRI